METKTYKERTQEVEAYTFKCNVPEKMRQTQWGYLMIHLPTQFAQNEKERGAEQNTSMHV